MAGEIDAFIHTPAPPGAVALDVRSPVEAIVDQPFPVIAAAMAVGTVAFMILGVQPVLLEALTQAHRLTVAQVGPLATVEDIAIAAGSAVGPAFMRRGGIRLKVIVLALLLAVADVSIYAVHSVAMLNLLRGAAGLIEGVMVGATLVVMIQHSQPDRMNALFLGLSTLPQAAMAYVMPLWIVPAYGANGGFVILAILALVSGASAVCLIDEAPPARPETTGKPAWTAAVFIALVAVLLQNAAIGGAWNYLPLLVDQHHFPSAMAGVAVAGGLMFQVAGAFAVAAWGSRFPFRAALILGAACQTIVIALLSMTSSPPAYVTLSLIFGLFWLALSPFQVRWLIDLDPTRNAAVLLTAFSLVGLSVGPFLSALGVRGADVGGAMAIAAGMMAAAILLYAGLVALG